jgi:hypothetical protein
MLLILIDIEFVVGFIQSASVGSLTDCPVKFSLRIVTMQVQQGFAHSMIATCFK